MNLFFCVCLVETLGATCAPRRNIHLEILFFRSHKSWTKQILYMKWSFDNLQNITIYYPSGIHKLSICSFLDYYWYKIAFMYIILRPSKRCLVHDTNIPKFVLSPAFDNNFDLAFRLYNNATFTLFQRMLFLHWTFSFKHTITGI